MERLKKMPGHTRLFRRGAVYYHRAAVPQDIAATYGKREETFSLNTRDYSEAVRRVRIAAVEVDRKFDEHRLKLARLKGPVLQELTPEQVATIKATYLHHLLDEDEAVRLDGFEEVEDGCLLSPKQFDPRPTFEERAELVDDLDEINRANYARGKIDAFHRDEAEEVLSWNGIELRLSPSSPTWPRLVRALQEASIEAAEAIKRRNRGDSVPTPADPALATPTVKPAPVLSDAIKLWSDEKSRGAWSPKVRDDHLAWANMFIEIAGDQPITNYRKADARAFKDVLMRLPANSQKKPETRGLPVKVAAEKAAQLGMEPMSVTTLNKGLRRVAAFWNWAEGHYDDVPTGLFKSLAVKTTIAARDQRDPFRADELRVLFASPLFTGCKSERYAAEPGDVVMNRSARFWLPLLGLFTGARLNELCQLAVEDVKQEDGIDFLHITNEGEDQRVKTASGRRRIPIHRQLLDLGFLALVEERRKEGSIRLFPELPKGKDGYFSGEFSKSFSRYLERIGIKTKKTSFHSLRHTFEDACRAATIYGEIMDALQGHAEGGQRDRYGSGYPIRVLNEALQRISYPSVDLSALPRLTNAEDGVAA